jgi:hypothetical protein
MADGATTVAETEGEALSNEFDVGQLSPWTCSPVAYERLFHSLKQRWLQVQKKQSIPDIVAFAKAVEAVGDRHEISILSRYGSQLAAHADAFDIQRIEKLLGHYQTILDLWIEPSVYRLATSDERRTISAVDSPPG